MGRVDGLFRNDRGNMAVVIFVFFGTIVVGAFLWVLLNQAWTPMIDMATNASNTSDSAQGIDDAKTAWDVARGLILVLTAVLGLAGAAASSGRL